jgi:tRNA-specific 2-thiouridylase
VKIVVGMSGGVDSSVAALLLKRQGHEVVGLFMKNWEDDDDDEYCSTREDLIDAAAAADIIGIDLEAVNFAAEYKDRVFAEFLREYSAGRTPNPDVLCNAEIKFKAFLDHALRLGAEKIATGHYARTDGARLLKGKDGAKDQSYFLHRLNQEQLSRVLFPVGEMKKADVRRVALEAGLPNHAKKDSTGICFIGERPFREFLNRYLPKAPGKIVDEKGKTVGEHMGLAFYTIGQRKGIGLGGPGEPWYVAEKRLKENELVVVRGHDHPLLLKRSLAAGGCKLDRPCSLRGSESFRKNQIPAGRLAVHAEPRRGFGDQGRLPCAAVGGDTRAVGRALRWRGLSRGRDHHVTIAANIMIGLVALLHVYFLVLEMFLWDKPRGMRTFRTTPEYAAASKTPRRESGAVQRLSRGGADLGILRRRPGQNLLPGLRDRRRRVRRGDGEPEDPLDPGAAGGNRPGAGAYYLGAGTCGTVSANAGRSISFL